MNIVGKFVTIEQFDAHVASLSFNSWRPSFVVVHNTSAPSLATYQGWLDHPEKHGNWTHEGWLRNLASYYAGQGWSAGPHAFVCPDGVGLFTPFTQRGTHSPSWNSRSWGIETCGEFETEPFSGAIKDNLIAVLGILHDKAGFIPSDYKLGVRGLHLHKEDPNTTHKSCPGKHLLKTELVAAVEAFMVTHADPGEHVTVPAAVHTAPTQLLSTYELTSAIWLQTSLNKLGANLVLDGSVGPKTKAAVKEFQTRNGLTTDGIAGPITRLAIKNQLDSAT